MNELNDEKLRELLKKGIGPVQDTELKQDLWPRMLRRLDVRPATIPWFDWALVGLVAMGFLLVPEVIPILLYYL